MPHRPAEPFRILVADPIAPEAVALLEDTPGFEVAVRTGLDPETLREILGRFDALIVRSATQVTAEMLRRPGRLKVVGRAGTGVDNIDLDAATRAGVVVMNTPGGNSVAAAEHALALMFALARNLPRAWASLQEGRWERKAYLGAEVTGKSLGLVGLGRIGREVARRARGLQMDVLAHDPFVSAEAAADMQVTLLSLDELLARADVVSLHTPLTEQTRGLMDAARLRAMKPGAFLINCARGGLVDETALLQVLEEGHLAGAALDVFQEEPPKDLTLVRHPRVVATPHLGASTREAQQRVGVEIAQKIRDFLLSGVILDAVNFPSIDRREYETLAPVMDLAERLGRFLAQAVEGGLRALRLTAHGEFSDLQLRPLAMAAAKGLLEQTAEGGVSYVNAPELARERGIQVEEARSTAAVPYPGLLRLTVETEGGSFSLAGTLFTRNRPKLVEVDGIPIDSDLSGRLLLLRNRDVPGVVGSIGTLLGERGVNIAGIQLGRHEPGSEAVSIIAVDQPVPTEVLEAIQSLPDVVQARVIEI